jgi:multidrug transporter EmrE-like cation transporter
MASVITSKQAPAIASTAGAQQRAGFAYTAEMALIVSVLLAACGHLLIKNGLNSVVLPAHAALLVKLQAYFLTTRVVAGLAIYGMGTMLWIVAVSKRDISYLYPFTSLNYVVITLGGMWLFGEPVSAGRWAGIMVVMLGVGMMHISTGGKKS